MKMKKKILSLLIILSLLVTSATSLAYGAENRSVSYRTAMDTTADYMVNQLKSPGYGAEWIILGLARSGADVPESYYDTYYRDVEKTVKDNRGVLDNRKYTEYSRVILALTAIGKDPSNVGGYNLLEKLADFENVIWQGINGPIWALIALDSGDYAIPQVSGVETQTSRELLIDEILSQEIDGGGFSLDGNEPDCDITAMAVQALSGYMDRSDVKAAVDRAVEVLSYMQKADGTFASWGTKNAESICQVIVALAALDIDPVKDDRFIRNGNTVIDALLTFYDENGGFRHVNTSTAGYEPIVNGMATEQSYYALTAYDRLLAGKTSLYDMSDVEKEDDTTTDPPSRDEEELIEAVEEASVKASTVLGDGYIKVQWTTSGSQPVDAYEIYRSLKKDSGYGSEPYYTTKQGGLSGWYKNSKGLTKGTRYYYKVRGKKTIDGNICYTKWSNVAYRTYSGIGAGVRNTTIKASSAAGKGYIKISWKKSAGYAVDKYQVFRSTKKNSGYGTKAYFTTKNGTVSSYKNTAGLKKGTRYYYKVRGVRQLDGSNVYTKWSNKAYRIAK